MRGVLGGAAVALVALALVATTANATDWCMNQGPYLRVGAPGVADVAYVTYECTFTWCGNYLFSIWVYLESNGVPDLQRGGVTILGDTDPCQDYANHDMGVF